MKSRKGTWELYDLSGDISETNNLADEQPDVLARLMVYVEEANTKSRKGTVYDQELAEKDRYYTEEMKRRFQNKKAGK